MACSWLSVNRKNTSAQLKLRQLFGTEIYVKFIGLLQIPYISYKTYENDTAICIKLKIKEFIILKPLL